MHPSNCKNCGNTTLGNYCEQCGQKTAVAPITLQGIAHEAFHYFTHLDSGFGYTLKKLITEPGIMQRHYIDGERTRHQKPFTMFFLCGTISGLGYYFINLALAELHGYGDATANVFFRHYFVVLQAALLPLYTFITWLFFKNEPYSYAETLVMTLYNMALIYLVLLPIVALKLIFPSYQYRILEVAFLLFYNTATNLNFYGGSKAWIIGKTLLVIGARYTLSQIFSGLALRLLQQ